MAIPRITWLGIPNCADKLSQKGLYLATYFFDCPSRFDNTENNAKNRTRYLIVLVFINEMKFNTKLKKINVLSNRKA